MPAPEKYNIQDVDALLIPCIGATNNICGKFFMSSWAKISLWKLLTRMPGKVFSGSREKRGIPVKKGARELLSWLKEQGAVGRSCLLYCPMIS